MYEFSPSCLLFQYFHKKTKNKDQPAIRKENETILQNFSRKRYFQTI
jgi:hypothetical protein